jgi:ornithine cyclodeaminase/alanine dehydrogenase-like protein (mu-crystallin family)
MALMDSIEITINRTGAATTLAAHIRAPGLRVATICARAQGRIQARVIAAAAKLDTIHVWDIRPMPPRNWRANSPRN